MDINCSFILIYKYDYTTMNPLLITTLSNAVIAQGKLDYHPTSPPSHLRNLISRLPTSVLNTHRSRLYVSYAPFVCFMAEICFGPDIALIACRRLGGKTNQFRLLKQTRGEKKRRLTIAKCKSPSSTRSYQGHHTNT